MPVTARVPATTFAIAPSSVRSDEARAAATGRAGFAFGEKSETRITPIKGRRFLALADAELTLDSIALVIPCAGERQGYKILPPSSARSTVRGKQHSAVLGRCACRSPMSSSPTEPRSGSFFRATPEEACRRCRGADDDNPLPADIAAFIRPREKS